MLDSLEERIKWPPTNTGDKGKVIVLHQMGSHGPAYYKRSSMQRKPFQPECKSASLQQCTQQEIINTYDTRIVETNHFINNSKQQCTMAEKRVGRQHNKYVTQSN